MIETCVTPNGTVYEKHTVAKRDPKNQHMLIFAHNIEMVRMQRDMLQSSGLRNITSVASIDALKAEVYQKAFGTIIINESTSINPLEIITFLRDYKTCRDPCVQVLFASSYCTEALIKLTVRSGYDAVLSVPFSKTRLWKTVEQLSLSQRIYVKVGNYFGPDRRQGLAPNKEAQPERRSEELEKTDTPTISKAG